MDNMDKSDKSVRSRSNSKTRKAGEKVEKPISSIKDQLNQSIDSGASSDASIVEEDRILTPSQHNQSSNKLNKQQSEEISNLRLENFIKAEHTLNKSHDPNDIFAHFTKIVHNTLEGKIRSNKKINKQILVDFQTAANFTKSRIAEATRHSLLSNTDNQVVLPPSLEESYHKLQEKFDKLSHKLKNIEEKIEITTKNTNNIPEIVTLIPKLNNTLQTNVKTLNETKVTMAETQQLMEKIDSSTRQTNELGVNILKNLEILTTNTYSNLENITTKTFENMATLSKNTYETMEQMTEKALESMEMSKVAKTFHEIPEKINKIFQDKSTTNNQQGSVKESKDEQKLLIRITQKKEAQIKETIPYIKNFFKQNNLPTPQDLTTNKQKKTTIQLTTLEDLEQVKTSLNNNDEFKLNFIINKYAGQRIRLLIFNTLLPEEKDSQEEILMQNEFLKAANVNIIKTFKTKKTGKLNMILEVDKLQGDLLLQKGNIFIDFQRYGLTHYKEIKRCFNCQAFGHYSGMCRNETRCQNCGDKHNTRDCKSEDQNCANCTKNKLDVTSHNANSQDCPIFLEYKKSLFTNSS